MIWAASYLAVSAFRASRILGIAWLMYSAPKFLKMLVAFSFVIRVWTATVMLTAWRSEEKQAASLCVVMVGGC